MRPHVIGTRRRRRRLRLQLLTGDTLEQAPSTSAGSSRVLPPSESTILGGPADESIRLLARPKVLGPELEPHSLMASLLDEQPSSASPRQETAEGGSAKNNNNRNQATNKTTSTMDSQRPVVWSKHMGWAQSGLMATKELLLRRNYTAIMIIMLIGGSFIRASQAVDCFKCSSRNGSNPACEDPFHNLNTTRITAPVLPDPQPHVIYHTPCYAGRKGKDGLFPASACIKLTGTFEATGETLVVRHCALDSGTLTQDTELARMSHCGKFQFEGDLLRGCVLACPEDACNSATRGQGLSSLHCAVVMVLAWIIMLGARARLTLDLRYG